MYSVLSSSHNLLYHLFTSASSAVNLLPVFVIKNHLTPAKYICILILHLRHHALINRNNYEIFKKRNHNSAILLHPVQQPVSPAIRRVENPACSRRRGHHLHRSHARRCDPYRALDHPAAQLREQHGDHPR